MDVKKIASELSEIERKTLSALEEKELPLQELSEKSGVDLDSVRRAVQWLKEKGLCNLRTEKSERISLGEKGMKALEEGMPERRLLKELEEKGGTGLKEIRGLSPKELNAVLGPMNNQALIIMQKDKEKVTIKVNPEKSFPEKTDEEKLLEKISGLELGSEKLDKEEKKVLKSLNKRPDFIKVKDVSKGFASVTELGKQAREIKVGKRSYNLADPVPRIFIGKRQPYIQFLNQVKRRLTELGFREMPAPLIVQEFYNFDVLFQPQNHPARDWTESYQLKQPKKGRLPGKKIVNAIKAAHENGGKSSSKGWGYRWSEEIASRLMPAAHGTAHSARQLVQGVEVPGKYFSVARCFRPDVVDASHLIEFNQLEGFIVGEYSFRHLLGLLESFAAEIAGAEKVKFFPDYYPFTEPSVQLSALHPELGWVEFGGAGIFRPEIMENLGIKGRALAWGLGVDRLAMFKLGIKDIRQLFSQDLDWLRNAETVRE